MRVVLLGAPGSGKGTQSAFLEEKHGIPQISTGDILREAIAAKTPVGLEAKERVDSGSLVPDTVILDLVEDRIDQPDAANGFILDGFPRSIPQADGLKKLLDERGVSLDRVIKIDVSKKSILARMTTRRICPNCGAVYNTKTKPPKDGSKCDVCGTTVEQRPDDGEETVRKRLHVYEVATAPLIDYYDARGQLGIVDGEGDMRDVFERIEKDLQASA